MICCTGSKVICGQRFSNDYRKTNTEVITPPNYNRSKQRDEPITDQQLLETCPKRGGGGGHRQAADCPKFTNLCRNDARVVGEHLLTPAHFSIVILSPYCEECAQQFCAL